MVINYIAVYFFYILTIRKPVVITNYNWGRGERSKPNMSVEVNMTWVLLA